MIARAAAVLWLIGGGVAVAQTDTVEEAKAEFERGRTAFEEGRFAEAAKAFELAYQASHRPELLWNIAQSYRRQYEIDGQIGRLTRAREVYRNYAELAATEKEREDATREGLATDALIHEYERKAEAERQRQAVRPVIVEAPSTPIYRRWWFWTAIAVVVVAGAATGIALALTSDKTPSSAGGDWAPFGLTVGRWR